MADTAPPPELSPPAADWPPVPAGGTVMAGHQPGFWHAGILAKLLAAEAHADAHGAHAAWLVVDHDPEPPGRVRYPTRDGGRLVVRQADLLAGSIDPGDVPLRPMAGALASREGPPPRRAAEAGIDLACQLTGCARPRLFFASELAREPRFGGLVDRIAADPRACVEAHNAAVARFPGAGMRPLVCRPDRGRFELPLWSLGAGRPRLPVFAEELGSIDRARLAPRALLMTGFARLALCDLFVHGTGGGAYEPVVDAWFAGWLGEEALLAPFVTATATLRLDLGVRDVSEREAADAAWRAHAARHNPALLGDDASEREKRALVHRIEALPHGDRRRAGLYAELHALLERVRHEHAGRLAELDDAAAAAAAAVRDAEIALDRGWPFPLHPAERLRDLRERVRARFAPAAAG